MGELVRGEWGKVMESMDGGVREMVREDLGKVMEKREGNIRKMVRENVGKALGEWAKQMEGTRELESERAKQTGG